MCSFIDPLPLFYIQHNCGLLHMATQPDISLISISLYTVSTIFWKLRQLKEKLYFLRIRTNLPPAPKNSEYNKKA